ncbi:hypothetical protein OYC64_005061 [Pagothenia borchgrevinki]|uniref:Uncharacterized protein n=1 Tax=Pagothenia borchgrevinki TaxID=8213 RepID=A0ABD2GFF1_PAGBO
MDADTEENVTETSRISKDEPQKTLVDNTFRGRGFRSRGQGGRMSRGGMRGGRGHDKRVWSTWIRERSRERRSHERICTHERNEEDASLPRHERSPR